MISDYLSAYLRGLEIEFVKNADSTFKKRFSKKITDQLKSMPHKELIWNIQTQLLEVERRDDVIGFVQRVCADEFKVEGKLLGFSDFYQLSEEYYYLPLLGEQDHFLFFCWKGDQPLCLSLYILLTDYFDTLRVNEISKRDLENWNMIKNSIEIPILMLGNKGQVLIHNDSFIHLNYSVKKCLELENNEQVTINKNTYRVVINKDQLDNSSFIFFAINNFLLSETKASSEELGIISSSIAHELNNPLGGVLAAIEVLALDVEDNNISEQLEDMKHGVLRCKKLVETFLGFSRYQTLEGEQVYTDDWIMEESVQQALSLMRFRLIENNYSLNLKYHVKKVFRGKLNPHIVSMAFYLIFGEILTAFSHANLVSQGRDHQLDVVINENNSKIEIKTLKEFNFMDNLESSKLLHHLCDIEKIKINKKSGSSFELRYDF